MLSPFLKKLMFARQFDMDQGSIEVLGQREIMLPAEIVGELQRIDTKKSYQILKSGVQRAMEADAKRIGLEGEGVLKIAQEIFCTYGLGKPEIVNLDNKTKRCVVRVHAPSDSAKPMLAAALAGMFSVIFNKDINCSATTQKPGFLEFALA